MTKSKSNRTSFKPGQSGNPAGKKPGSGALQKLRAELQVVMPEIVTQLIDMALGGDLQAMRLLLDRGYPPTKATEQPVEIDMPDDGSLTIQGRAVLSAVARGDLAPGQGAQLLAAIGSLARVIEIDELTQRIDKLEAANVSK